MTKSCYLIILLFILGCSIIRPSEVEVVKNNELKGAVVGTSSTQISGQNSLDLNECDTVDITGYVITLIKKDSSEDKYLTYYGFIHEGSLTNLDEDFQYLLSLRTDTSRKMLNLNHSLYEKCKSLIEFPIVYGPMQTSDFLHIYHRQFSCDTLLLSGLRLTLFHSRHPKIEDYFKVPPLPYSDYCLINNKDISDSLPLFHIRPMSLRGFCIKMNSHDDYLKLFGALMPDGTFPKRFPNPNHLHINKIPTHLEEIKNANKDNSYFVFAPIKRLDRRVPPSWKTTPGYLNGDRMIWNPHYKWDKNDPYYKQYLKETLGQQPE